MDIDAWITLNQLHEWTLVYDQRPWTTNAERGWHPHKRAKLVKEWREAFKKLAAEAGIPALKVFYIEATPLLKDRKFQDTAACNPAVKAAIDGLIDAGVAPDDKPQWLHWILFNPCQHTPGFNGLQLRVIGVLDD